ncbi:MAG: xanthine dehydrogenase family protein subunit M [Proteobacteria bacterium]|nr:xanthine dehydrogenase family protein subunit M [Pseudomonadota bacterium]MDA1059488.1 xanthine dehydrogenase family protein subunit M [Pseudomonadota bacterium]
MYQFEYHKASSVEDAMKKLASADDGKILAGGMTLLPTMKQRLASPSDLIDLSGIAALKGIKVDGKTVTIGAMTTHWEVHSSKDVQKAIPALSDLAGQIGDPMVRHRGTIGGSIANSDPSADYPAAVIGLGATIKTNKRDIAADDYFKGLFETALADDELIVSVSFPIPKRAAYQKFPQPASRYAMVGVMVAETDSGIRVGVTGAGPCAFRVPAMEKALGAKFAAESVANITIPSDGLNSDIHGSAEYRAHLVGVMAKRAVAAA